MSVHPENVNNPEVTEASQALSNIIRFLRDLVVIFLIALFLRAFVFIPFKIVGTSMNDSYSDGEYIIVNKFSYLNFETHFNDYLNGNPDVISGTIAKILKNIPIHIGDPERGDAIVLKPHVDQSHQYYIKRVIGMPGETIRIGSGQVSIKPKNSEEFITISEPYLSLVNTGNTFIDDKPAEKIFTIPEDSYWVMGDNRIRSSDSRNCFQECRQNRTHFLSRQDVVGKVGLSLGHFDAFETKK